MENRQAHCAFAKLNRQGRCIADCHENRERDFDSDCTGNAAPTFDYDGAHEVRVSCGFLDGRDYFTPVHHAKGGYSVTPTAKAMEKAQLSDEDNDKYIVAFGWGTYKNMKTGKVFRWITDDNGNRVKEYIK